MEMLLLDDVDVSLYVCVLIAGRRGQIDRDLSVPAGADR